MANPSKAPPPCVAVIADAHYHDSAGDYGMDGPALRSWADTRIASRAINESRSALLAALDEIARRGIRHVVMLGDYSDDGQRESVARVAGVMHDYQRRHGMAFYALPGNHDLYALHGKHHSTRYLNRAWRSILVTSDPEMAAAEPASAVLTRQMYCDGLPDALRPMAAFGLFRSPAYLYWETPFGQSDAVEARLFRASSADGSVSWPMMDSSYLVEPERGLWLLMIDANVFEPRSGRSDPTRKQAFLDPSTAGWNAVLRVKPYLLSWIRDVHARARALGKSLLAFSHYPVLDPYGSPGSETAMFGVTEAARRTPLPSVAEALVETGMPLHFSGHIHANATTVWHGAGCTLTNIAVPSLVSFPPGFKIVKAGAPAAVETVSLAGLPPDTGLRRWYARQSSDPEEPGLGSADFGTFLLAQLRARVLERTVPETWPPDLAEAIQSATLADLVCLMLKADPLGERRLNTLAPPPPQVAHFATTHGMTVHDFARCPLTDLIADWYALRQAGDLMQGFLTPERRALYKVLAKEFGDCNARPEDGHAAFFARFLGVMAEALRGMPASEPPET